MLDDFIPDWCLPLAQAVFEVAKSNDPETWAGLLAHETEIELYRLLGTKVQPYEIAAAAGISTVWTGSCEFDRLLVILKILLLPGAKNRFASYRRAERKLRQLLYAGHVPFLLLTQSGQLKWAAPFIWGQAKAQNWFDCGELVMPLGTKTTVDLGSAVPGLTDDSGLVYVPDGVECKIVIPRHWLSPALARSQEVSSHGATEQGDAAERGGIVIGDDLSGPGVEAPASAHSEPATTRGIMAVVEAAREIWKPDGIPPVGLHFETRNNMIKDELRKSGRTTSGRTIQRAMVLIETLAASGRNWPQ